MDNDAMRTLYRKWLPGLWSSEPEEMPALAEEIFTPDAVGHWGDGRDQLGPKAIAAMVQETFTMFDDVSVTLLAGPIVDGDWIAARWEFAGRYLGGVAGIGAAAGTRVRYPGMDLFRVAGDRLAEYWPHGADLSLMQQLDALG
ncbi:ester cyclase [Nocardia flavorosea]|uniref:Ester cyclase n=1 Tax=Nocardia flavorosea TaxID=53429 RepID=A0A846YAJ2_9NOCA|nr:ester cyclase [Nocardia flavorosea]NKY55545.1 ester cyclase [Nocardia flavorosea]